MKILKSLNVYMLFAMCFFTPLSAKAEVEHVGQVSQPLTIYNNVENWTKNGNVVPVCWETLGYDREKNIVMEAVKGTWEYFSNIQFTGWNICPSGGIFGSATEKNVRIRISAQDNSNLGAGGSARPGMSALSSANDNDPGVNLSFNPDGTADQGRVEYVAVHEFGHVLGFNHEQDTPGNVEGPTYCKSSGSEPNTTPLTPYDRDSIMNYCNRDGNIAGNLTDIDIAGVQKVYGVRRQNIASLNSCASALIKDKQVASLAAPWNDNNATSIAVYPSDRKKFLFWSQWSVRDGGWGDSIKWASGDFNGDGLSDLAAIWNNGGSNVLTVRASNGKNFSQVHWLENAGGWSDSTVWLPGDFNGDGKADLAGVWNNGGLVSIAVYPSDGKKFLFWSQWTDRDGGWGDTIRWVSGDFNGDGKTDIGAAWNNNGVTTLTVRLSQGDKFNHVHWNLNAGDWFDSSIFVAGDFNKDGKDDIAQMWNDLSKNSIKVSLSNGSKFLNSTSWSRRDGGWGGIIKWVPGDFNGDGKTDIGAIWDNGGTNTLTVRASDGSKFTQAHWATNAGGWMDTTAWCAGKFQPNTVNYDVKTGQLLLSTVKVGNVFYSAELQNQGNYQFQLTQAQPLQAPQQIDLPEYHVDTGILNIPFVSALDNNFQLRLHQQNGVFVIDLADML